MAIVTPFNHADRIMKIIGITAMRTSMINGIWKIFRSTRAMKQAAMSVLNARIVISGR
jgi:hypothetical protein